jgi:uncharacterized protein
VHGPGLYVTAFLSALVISTVSTPAGVSGAVFLLPFQVSVLGTASSAATPTNLLYNVVATPGALYRYWRQGQTGGQLTAVLLVGTIPGVIGGAVIRALVLPGPQALEIIIAVVLIPLGAWLAVFAKPGDDAPHLALSARQIVGAALVVGIVGGIYGIGGGAILAPLLVGSGRSPREVAPATLTSTFVTSVAGVATFAVLSVSHDSSVAPDWGVGVALGVGGSLGGYLGALAQPHLADRVIRRILGLLVTAIGASYAYQAADG